MLGKSQADRAWVCERMAISMTIALLVWRLMRSHDRTEDTVTRVPCRTPAGMYLSDRMAWLGRCISTQGGLAKA